MCSHCDFTSGLRTEAISTAVQSRPFRPLGTRVADRLQVEIQNLDSLALHRDGREFRIFEPNGGFSIMDISLDTGLSLN
jgi:hypothetical protein